MSATDQGGVSFDVASGEVEPPPRPGPDLVRIAELAMSAALVLATSWYLVEAIRRAATTSLWTDELTSALSYSGRGPWTSITTYDAPNNHIFFNLLNSLTPGAGSVDPLRARIWSIVAIVAMLLLGLYEFGRRRWYLVGAFFFALFAASAPWLSLSLEARGYGLVAFFATAIAFWTWRYLEDRRVRWLVGIALATWAGTWTVPTFLLFAAPVLLLLLAFVRTKAVLLAGLASAVAIAAVYLPVASQLSEQLSTYSDDFGEQFTSPMDVVDSLRSFLMGDASHLFVALLWALAGLALVIVLTGRIVPVDPSLSGTVRILVGAVGLFFLGCLVMRTAPIRTTAFVAAPLAVAVLASVGAIAHQSSVPLLRWTTAVGLVVATIVGGLGAQEIVGRPEPAPSENWLGAARYIERTFPPGTPVFGSFRANFLDLYLDDTYPIVASFDPVAFAAGRLVVVGFELKASDKTFDAEVQQASSSVVETDLPQRRGKSPAHVIRIRSALPPPAGQSVTINGEPTPVMTDGNLATSYTSVGQGVLPQPFTIDVSVPSGTVAHSIVVSVGDEGRPRVFTVEVKTGDKLVRLPDSAVTRTNQSITVGLSDQPIDGIRISVRRAELRPFELSEAWFYPATGD